MGLIDDILQASVERKFDLFATSGMILVTRNTVTGFLDWLDGKATLLGAEGFRYEDDRLVPLMDCIIDYSTGEPRQGIEFHKRVIGEEPAFQKAVLIEFTFVDQESSSRNTL